MQIDGMNEVLINAMFETVPMEITVIDANDRVLAWNKHHTRLFNRPEACYGMDFRDCHGPKNLAIIERIVGEMKSGAKDKVRFWLDLEVDKITHKKNKILIEFFALRDINGKYLGCMECSQDIQEIMGLTGSKVLMDEGE
ncbi:MAG: PAS domain-containing protein [Oligoflexia bacterium]|nr:PAS domain-containing protein [Oligoflexia bacterium]